MAESMMLPPMRIEGFVLGDVGLDLPDFADLSSLRPFAALPRLRNLSDGLRDGLRRLLPRARRR